MILFGALLWSGAIYYLGVLLPITQMHSILKCVLQLMIMMSWQACFADQEIAAQAPLRVVVTLSAYDACDQWGRGNENPACATMVKCYGRRLVLGLVNCLNATDWLDAASFSYHLQGVVSVEEDFQFSPMQVSNDSLVVEGQWETVHGQVSDGTTAALDQWNLQMLNVQDLWANLSTYGEKSTVAVLDSGIASSALPAFQDRILPGYDFISDADLSMDGDGRDSNSYDPGDSDPVQCPGDSSWHGTKVTSVLGANYSGFFGVAPAVNILPVRVLGKCRTGYASDVADAIVWAAGGIINGMESFSKQESDERQRVIVMSFAGLGACPSFLQTAVDLAVLHGISLFAAAGNDPLRWAEDYFPANCKGVLNVGSLTWRNQVAGYTSQMPDLLTPGGDSEKGIPCLSSDLSRIDSCIGTSMAVPHASGLHALQSSGIVSWMQWNALQNATWISVIKDPWRYTMVQAQTLTGRRGLQISAGHFHTCITIQTGDAFCWGRNVNGQVGDNTIIQKNVVTQVQGTQAPLSVAAGQEHSCAMMSDSSVWCWGGNSQGQLGRGTFTSYQATALVISELQGTVSQMVVGATHSCALLLNGTVMCWGSGIEGQLGNGASVSSAFPVNVTGIPGRVFQISAGAQHTCALLVDKSQGIFCWGSNSEGQLGIGPAQQQSSSNVAVRASSVSSQTGGAVKEVDAGGWHTCVLLDPDGGVRCWGANSDGQLGNNSTMRSTVDVAVVNLGGPVIQLSAGLNHTCAVLSWTVGGMVQCWGRGLNGQLGQGVVSSSSVPVSVVFSGTEPFLQVSMGSAHTCALRRFGSVLCWGLNSQGQLGDNTVVQKLAPVSTVTSQAAPPTGTFQTTEMHLTSFIYCSALIVPILGDGDDHVCVHNLRLQVTRPRLPWDRITDAHCCKEGRCGAGGVTQMVSWGLGQQWPSLIQSR